MGRLIDNLRTGPIPETRYGRKARKLADDTFPGEGWSDEGSRDKIAIAIHALTLGSAESLDEAAEFVSRIVSLVREEYGE